MPVCMNCGEPAEHEHHVVPRVLGGIGTVWLCTDCHGKVHERQLGTSALTKEGLRRAKARGVKLGCPNGAAHLRKYGNALGVAGIKAKADDRAEGVRAKVTEIVQRIGDINLSLIARQLNKAGVPTPRGGRWHASSVKNLLDRLGPIPCE